MDRMFSLGEKKNWLSLIKHVSDSSFMTRIMNYNHSEGDGIHPAGPYNVNRFLPIRNEVYKGEGSYNRRLPIVIPHATLVAGQQTYASSYYSSADTAAGIAISGDVPVGFDALGNAIKAKTDDSFRMLGNGGSTLLTVANGGVDVTDKYGTLDVNHGTLKYTGVAAAAGDTFARPKNLPIGIAMNSVHQDDVGRVQGFTNKIVMLDQISTDWFIKIPGILIDRAKAALTAEGVTGYGSLPANVAAFAPGAAVGFEANVTSAYNELTRLFAFYYADEADLIYGSFVKPDQNGQFVAQYAAADAYGATAAKTIQTVGKTYEFDTKWPKDNNDLRVTFTDTKVTGTDTYGYPTELYIFAGLFLQNSGIASTDVDAGIKAMFKHGAIGRIRINLHVS